MTISSRMSLNDAHHHIDEETIKAYHRDGVTVVRGLFTDWVEILQAGVDANMSDPGQYARYYTEPGKPGHFFGDYCNWQRISQYRDFVENSPLGVAAAVLMNSNESRFFHEHVLVKEPGTGERTPWHHDQPYYSVDGRQNISFWIPLDPVEQSVCPEFIVGSHTWGRWFNPTRFTGVDWDRDQEKESMEYVPDIESAREDYDIVSWQLAAGDALVFNFLTLHGAPPNQSEHRRRGFSARVVGDDATWAKRSGETSPPYPELHAKLEHGTPFSMIEEFPRLYPND